MSNYQLSTELHFFPKKKTRYEMKKCNPTVTFLDIFQSILRFINFLEYSFWCKVGKEPRCSLQEMKNRITEVRSHELHVV